MTKKYIWLVAWILATALIVVLARQVDSTRLLAALNQADWKWLTLSIAANLCILPIGAMQWWVLLPPPPVISRMRMLRISSMTSMANNTTPAIVGHAAGGAMIAAEPGAGVFTGIRVIALDQVGVGIAKIVVLATTLAVAPVPGWVRTGLGVIIGGVAVMGAVLIGIGWLIKRTVPPGGQLSAVGGPIARVIGWVSALDVLASPGRFALSVVFALGVKAAEGVAIACVQAAFGLSVTPASTMLVLAALSISSLVPLTPANVGAFEAATYAAYVALGVDRDKALGIALVQHATMLVALITPGYLAMLRSPRAKPAIEAGPQ